jgi:hypothetical protein
MGQGVPSRMSLSTILLTELLVRFFFPQSTPDWPVLACAERWRKGAWPDSKDRDSGARIRFLVVRLLRLGGRWG